MLENMFSTVIKMSVMASIAAIMVIFLRQLIGKKLPRTFSYAAWAIVLIRLLVPFSMQSDLSLFNIVNSPITAIDTAMRTDKLLGISASQNAIDIEGQGKENKAGITNEAEPGKEKNMNVKNGNNLANSGLERSTYTNEVGLFGEKGFISVMSRIWVSVLLILLFSCIFAYLKFMGILKTAVLFDDNGLLAECCSKLKLKRKVNIYVSDRIDTPVVSGIANVRIIIPAFLAGNCSSKELEYVIIHELVHIKRHDNITKLLALLSLCIHWFNPLIWICFSLYQKDMEMSCDARVLTAYENDIRTEYANSLLNVAAKQNALLHGAVLAFGKSNIKSRIKGIMKFKKNKVGLVVFAALLFAVFAFILLTNGKNESIFSKRSFVINPDKLNDLLEHRNRYIGNASNVGNLLDKLPYGRNKEGFELDTKSKPYGITINYRLNGIDASSEDTDALNNVKPTLLDNALILFSLIENVDIVKFNILPSNTVVQFERAQLQKYFDRELWEYSSSEKDFEKFLLDIYFEIFVYPEKYSLDMSSELGMQISIALNTEYYDAAHSISYLTENGSLLTRNADIGKITDHGKSLDLPLASLEPVYWSPLDTDEAVEENIITISVKNKKGNIIISKHIRVEKEDDNIFTVKPSYDISYDGVKQDISVQ